jgi:hypothetical protein
LLFLNDPAAAVGALEFSVTDRGFFVGEQSAAKAMCFLNDPAAAMIAAEYETEGFWRDFCLFETVI